MAASEEAVHEIIRTQLLDNPMDSLARQLRRVYAKLEKKERAGDVSGRRRYAAKLRELLTKGVAELEFQHRQLGAAINIVELDQKAGLFESGKASSSPKAKDDAEVPTIADIAIGAQVAARVARSHELWILASVVRRDAKTRLYEVEDEDSGDEDTEGKRHHLVPRDWMIPLPREEEVHAWISFKWNQKVLAMYPSTTSFYPAVVVIPNPPGSLYVVVCFDDDADEVGYCPERKVPFRFVTPLLKK
ncbi:hypothetical protein SPRG_12846 [Saprolegnia parasitica CBS 223.65]|uniref:SGF29 C-terminal domain-containing protein n=1 Tax=Saprolegnia parasitica (strain CBS 223.65) TaxID=695850 RepID=A0A067C5Z1_SAPPC|nr:hypothetical protein SPRG_12846 [Saprolegnia parasitica CBS 223.65]KDO21981.1 hypothetical protein SPRG_12846 [Saprolegnia parasitica CBS 223.65]|eukprot:XP_012207320.1 hypothetical protein SPRG_12846 [Saprolegnia parasitica CBS 223.65]